MIQSKLAVAVVLSGVLFSATVSAQPLPTTPMFQQVIGARLRLAIVSGRIVNMAGWQFGNGTSSTSNGANKEQFTFRGGMGMSGSLQYERTTPQEVFSLEISSDSSFRFQRNPKADSNLAAIQFSQTPGEPLSWTVGPEGKQQVCQAQTLWHLMISYPEESRPLVTLLEQLRPQWQIRQIVAAAEAQLLKGAGGKRPDREQWAKLVGQLAEEQFTRREAADRQLRAAGPSVLGYLQQLDFSQLDAEQQSRIRRMIRSLARQTADDTPEQIAAWLSEDPTVWLALLSRPEETVRRTAAAQLAAILGETVPVDPAADPATQKDQREKLRARIEKAKPSPPKRS